MNQDPAQASRKGRRRHMSRFGCRNCKLRKLKCDETRPHCTRCRTYGVVCNFGFKVPDLQPLSEGRPKQDLVRQSRSFSLWPPISTAIWSEDGSSMFTLDSQDQELFKRFRYRTLQSLGGSAMVEVYEKYMLKASFTCPFLMHGALAVTAVHDRYLGVTPSHRHSIRESHHWSQCTTLFNKWLSQPLREEYKDALWATTGILAVLAFSSTHASCSEEAWPLRPPDSSDLEWLRLGAGKMAIRHLVNPLRQGSVFRAMSETIHTHQPLPTRGIQGVSEELVQLCGLDRSSTQENNPYFTVAHSLSRLPEALTDEASQGKVMRVSGQMHCGFGACLERKDPVALLLLCMWYIKAGANKWWIDVRARYEIPAICMYLRRHHESNIAIQRSILLDRVEAAI